MKKFIISKPVLSFFIFSLLWTWIFFGLIVAFGLTGSNFSGGDQEKSFLFYSLFLFGALGPGVAGLIFTKVIDGKISHLFERIKFLNRNKYWYLILLLPFGVVLFTRLFFALFDAPPAVNWTGWEAILIFSFFSGIVQEFGWRGFAQEKFSQRNSPLITGIVVGFMWGFWSLAGFYWMSGDSLGKLLGVYFIASAFIPLLAYSIIMSWIYKHTNGNLLLMILFHASIIFFLNMFLPSVTSAIESIKLYLVYSMVVFILAALISLSSKTMWSKEIG